MKEYSFVTGTPSTPKTNQTLERFCEWCKRRTAHEPTHFTHAGKTQVRCSVCGVLVEISVDDVPEWAA